MDRLFDKTIVFAGSLAILVITPFSTAEVVALLVVLVVSGLLEAEVIGVVLRKVLLVVYLALALVFPAFALFVPLIVYDCFRTRSWPLCVGSFVPIVALSVIAPLQVPFFVLVVSGVACGLSLRSDRVERERARFKSLRDDLQEASLMLEGRNRDLLERQDYEVTLATLNERGRIAREIHDNVGHLLTRSVLQVEALQIIHEQDSVVREEFAQVGQTLHEALDTIRMSVHDLHDDSFDLRTQLLVTARNENLMSVEVEYEADAVPPVIGYCFVAIVRESIANAAKHSDADHIAVSVVEYPAFFRLIVHDNGSMTPFSRSVSDVGTSGGGPFGPAPLLSGESFRRRVLRGGRAVSATSEGIGLRSMEDRARALGGLLRTDYDRGFRVFVSIPKENV